MLSRRTFIARTSFGGFGLYWWSKGGATLLATMAGSPTLEASSIDQFVTPLLVPPSMPRAGRLAVRGGKNIDYYEIAVRQFQQQMLPASWPATTVWGYGPSGAPPGLTVFHAPSLTIEATAGTPVRIRWVNQLMDADGRFLPHLLAVDPTLHWANPPGGAGGRDMRPAFEETPGPYSGPVPLVTHVHGAASVGDESDGYAEAWFLPDAVDIPASYAREGTWYRFFADKAAAQGFVAPGTDAWEPGTAVCQYPNSQRASTLWYHDHTLGMTRLNVYAGPAGFFILRGGADDIVLDARSGERAILPAPSPARGLSASARHHEVAIAIQDRSFNSDGSLFYPDSREFFDGVAGPYVPFTDVSPMWNPEFFGSTIIANGRTWPFLDVEQRRYRFRLLNGCNARFLILDFNDVPGADVWQLGTEGGFLAEPVHTTGMAGNRILLAPAERVDVIVDFTTVPTGHYTLYNVGPDEPFGGGEPGVDFEPADAATTGRVLQFRVRPIIGVDNSTPPEFLQLPAIVPLTGGLPRGLALLEHMSHDVDDAPVEALLGTVSPDTGAWVRLEWADPITENPHVGDTEVWEFFNATEDAHPIHIHETLFQVVDRQAIEVDETHHTARLVEGSVPRQAEPGENGWKDTVIAYPGEVTRVRATFETPGQFVWHCHIVEHEDNEMMRPYRIGPPQPGSPG
jgi:spore coat protein A, manganese oxidase